MTARSICAGPARFLCTVGYGHLCFDLIDAIEVPPSPGASLVAKVEEGVDRSPGRSSSTTKAESI